MWALSLKLKDKLDKSNLREEELISWCGSYGEREKGEKESFQNFYLRSAEFRLSEFVGPRMKIHLFDKGYAWVLKTWDFIEDSSEEFGKSKVLGLGSVHGTS